MNLTELDFQLKSGNIYAEVESGENIYPVIINSLGSACSCKGYNLRELLSFKCKHIKLVHLKILEEGLSLKFMEEVYKKMSFLKTGLKFFDDLFDGIPKGNIMAFAGCPESGKSSLLAQLLSYINKIEDHEEDKSYGVAYIDTEGGIFDVYENTWLERFNAKYGTDFGLDLWVVNYDLWELGKKKTPDSKKFITAPFTTAELIHVVDSGKQGRIHIINLIGTDGYEVIGKLNLLLGKPALIKISEKGHMTFKKHQAQDTLFSNVKKTILGKFIADHNIKAFGLDSLTMPIEDMYAGGVEAFPARTKNNMQLCNQMQKLVATYQIYGIVNHHITVNPTQPKQYQVPKLTGSKGTRHPFKYQAFFDIFGESLNKRWFGILRHPTKGRSNSQTKRKFIITGEGIKDLEE